MSNISAITAYTQAYQTYQSKSVSSLTSQKKSQKVEDASVAEQTTKTTSTDSSLTPVSKEGYGFTIGDVSLSDAAKSYYSELKAKFSTSEFILVSSDLKASVQANASAYGNASKMVILIDEEKLERMATDESYRKKYEGIIAMSQSQLEAAKSSLASSGASVKNFGISVSSDGTSKYFATLEQTNAKQSERLEKKRAEKKEEKLQEKKKAQKEEREEKLTESKEEVTISSDSLEDLFAKVASFAYDYSQSSVMTPEEMSKGQHIDFVG